MTATRSVAFPLTSSALWMTLLFSPLLAAHPLPQSSSQASAGESKGSVQRISAHVYEPYDGTHSSRRAERIETKMLH